MKQPPARLQLPSLAALLTASLLALVCNQAATAQTEAPKPPNEAAQPSSSRSHDGYERWMATSVDRSYKLRYAQSVQDQNEVLTAVRNMVDPMTKIFMVPSVSTIVVHAPEDVQASVSKLINTLDQPHPRYRVTYTLTELDGTRKIGVQHFSTVVSAGQRAELKQGSRLPVTVSGSQFTYIDVGVNFDLTLTELQGGVVLKSKIEQTSVAPDAVSPTNPNPIIRQTQLEGTTNVLLNKALVVGSLDVPSSTRHFDVEVVAESAN